MHTDILIFFLLEVGHDVSHDIIGPCALSTKNVQLNNFKSSIKSIIIVHIYVMEHIEKGDFAAELLSRNK